MSPIELADRLGEIADRATVVALAADGLHHRPGSDAIAAAAYAIADLLRDLAAEVHPDPEAVVEAKETATADGHPR